MRVCRSLVVACLASLLLAGTACQAAKVDKDAKKEVKPLRFGEIELKGAYPEGAAASGLFSANVETLAELITRIDKAAADEKLDGVVLKINGATLGWAKVNELRQAIAHLRAKGKTAVAYFDSAETHDYLLACACNQIVMPESGELAMLGLRAEVMFYKNLLDWLHVKAEMLRVGEFKSAAEPYDRTEMSKEFRMEMDAILDDYVRQIVDGVGESRKMPGKKVMEIIDNGPYSAKQAYAHGLIDHVGYEDQVESFIKAAAQDEKRPVEITKSYGKKKSDNDFSGFAGMMKMMNLLMGGESQKRVGSKPKVAVVHAVGTIVTGKSTASFFGGESLGSETFIKAIKQAAEEKSVKAIVLRVDSPGGSALASDLMWRALQKAGKPIVVSMGDVAASGGYYISMGANHIFAEPGTLTGSIGVVGGKVAIGGLLDKVGITTSVISRGKNSGIMSMVSGFTPTERQSMQHMLDEIYGQFTRKAAEGRKMEYTKLEKLARGRVYTGAMALKLNLVDELGTLDDAVRYAAKLGGLPAGEKIDRWLLPPPVSPLEAIFGSMDSEAESSVALNRGIAQALRQFSPELAESLQGAWLINLLAREPRLTLMPFRIRVH